MTFSNINIYYLAKLVNIKFIIPALVRRVLEHFRIK